MKKNINNKIERVTFDLKQGYVWLNDDLAIIGILPSVWDYLENGYQVVMKYLVDRKKSEFSQRDMDDFVELVKSVMWKVMNNKDSGEVRECTLNILRNSF